MLLENFNLKEDAKMPIQKKLWERRKRKELKIWRAGKDSLLMKTLDTEKQKGVTKHEETMRERLLHAAAVADLHDNSNKSLFMFTLDSPLRCNPRSPSVQKRDSCIDRVIMRITGN